MRFSYTDAAARIDEMLARCGFSSDGTRKRR